MTKEIPTLPVNDAFVYPEGYTFNLSDFALFLSVMKHKKAYENVLSIILDEPDVKMAEVKVEQVILNKFGKRAIRLDAWGRTTDERQINMEMENHAGNDNIQKRSRFYQGLLDTPILKAGKKTKYRELPSTTIIFITQEDIFGKDIAKYTFTEQCEEIPGLPLEDGTTKIFLNMSSKNGSQELISLLQYMRNTTLENPEITVKDKRIVELDRIVSEVKESEEWEAVQMNILEVGIEKGKAEGIQLGKAEGIQLGKTEGRKLALIEMVCRKLQKGKTPELIAEELEEEYSVITDICEAAENVAPDYDCEQIYQIMKR